MKLNMQATLRYALAGAVAVVAAGTVAVTAAADRSPNHANRLDMTFEETRVSIHDRSDLGMRQVIASGTGTFAGYGDATELAAVSIDLSVTPCGPGSNTSTVLRRVVVPQGTLVLKTRAHRCPAQYGINAIGEYEVDGAASTGVFAGAWGRGSDTVEVGPPPAGHIVATISGKLHLAQPGEDD
jgi:hypothetical protein